MSFGTVLPYACIMDGPQVLGWWSDVEGKEPGVRAGEVAAVASGDESSVTPGLASLSLNLSVSGMLLFLHSAVREQESDSRRNICFRGIRSDDTHGVRDHKHMPMCQ